MVCLYPRFIVILVYGLTFYGINVTNVDIFNEMNINLTHYYYLNRISQNIHEKTVIEQTFLMRLHNPDFFFFLLLFIECQRPIEFICFKKIQVNSRRSTWPFSVYVQSDSFQNQKPKGIEQFIQMLVFVHVACVMIV